MGQLLDEPRTDSVERLRKDVDDLAAALDRSDRVADTNVANR